MSRKLIHRGGGRCAVTPVVASCPENVEVYGGVVAAAVAVAGSRALGR